MWHSTQKKLEREQQILLSLKKLSYLSRSQLQYIHRLGKERNASRIMANMEREGLIKSFRLGENIYCLSAAGKKRVGATRQYRKNGEVVNYILRNYVYIKHGFPKSWESDVIFTEHLTADAVFYSDGIQYLVEVDRLQHNNEKKIQKYKEAIENNVIKPPFRFIWVANTEYNKDRIEKLLSDFDVRVYLAQNLKDELLEELTSLYKE